MPYDHIADADALNALDPHALNALDPHVLNALDPHVLNALDPQRPVTPACTPVAPVVGG